MRDRLLYYTDMLSSQAASYQQTKTEGMCGREGGGRFLVSLEFVKYLKFRPQNQFPSYISFCNWKTDQIQVQFEGKFNNIVIENYFTANQFPKT